MECPEFEKELTRLINRAGLDNECNTPDFIIAKFLMHSLSMLHGLNNERDNWWGFIPEIGNPHIEADVPKSHVNAFKHVQSVEELMYQFAGASSVCWVGGTGNKVFDDAQARRFADDAIKTLIRLKNERTEIEKDQEPYFNV